MGSIAVPSIGEKIDPQVLRFINSSSYPRGSITVELNKTYVAVISGNVLQNGTSDYSAWVEWDGVKHGFPGSGEAAWHTNGGVHIFTPKTSTTVRYNSSPGSSQSGNRASFTLVQIN